MTVEEYKIQIENLLVGAVNSGLAEIHTLRVEITVSFGDFTVGLTPRDDEGGIVWEKLQKLARIKV